eukprot:gene15861-biopygen15772
MIRSGRHSQQARLGSCAAFAGGPRAGGSGCMRPAPGRRRELAGVGVGPCRCRGAAGWRASHLPAQSGRTFAPDCRGGGPEAPHREVPLHEVRTAAQGARWPLQNELPATPGNGGPDEGGEEGQPEAPPTVRRAQPRDAGRAQRPRAGVG